MSETLESFILCICSFFLATFLVAFLMTQMFSKDWILFSQSLYIGICFSSSVIIKYTVIRLLTFSYWILYLIAQCAHVSKRWTPTGEKQAWMAFCYLQCCQTERKKRGQKQTVISFGSGNEPSRLSQKGSHNNATFQKEPTTTTTMVGSVCAVDSQLIALLMPDFGLSPLGFLLPDLPISARLSVFSGRLGWGPGPHG